MKIYSALQIGAYHLNHCEDYLVTADIGNNRLLCAVMDGCTMGTDSYFVSTFVGKFLQKIAKIRGYQELYQSKLSNESLDATLCEILEELFTGLLLLKSQLLLELNDLLTTLLIMLVDKKTDKGLILVIGDGVICVNGKVTEFDHDNKPDYLGFHLHQEFGPWYRSQSQKVYVDEVKDISLATDGIMLFKRLIPPTTEEEVDPIPFLLQDTTNEDKDDMLFLKLKHLEHTYGLQPTDDLAIIRLIR
jgi:hypothetical protein